MNAIERLKEKTLTTSPYTPPNTSVTPEKRASSKASGKLKTMTFLILALGFFTYYEPPVTEQISEMAHRIGFALALTCIYPFSVAAIFMIFKSFRTQRSCFKIILFTSLTPWTWTFIQLIYKYNFAN